MAEAASDQKPLKRTQELDGHNINYIEESNVQRKRRKRGGGNRMEDPRAVQFKRQLDVCSKESDWKKAFELYMAHDNKEFLLIPNCYNTLLHLCSLIPSVMDKDSEDVPDLQGVDIYDAAVKMFEDMETAGISRSEASYSAIIKVACRTNQPDKAMEWVPKMIVNGFEPRLRTYIPILLAFCHQKDLEKVFEIYNKCMDAKLLLAEPEYMAMLTACMEAGNTEKAQYVMDCVKTEIPYISGDHEAVVKRWFQNFATKPAGVTGWDVLRTTVSDEGTCSVSGNTLKAIDLTPEERSTLAAGIGKLALERESEADFEGFKEWLKKGPVKWLVDGANVGMYNQNFQHASFHFKQVDRLMKYLETIVPEGDGKPLLVLHSRRVSAGPAVRSPNQQIVGDWKKRKVLYTTPHGSNDDWYWLYAAVVGGEESFLVTNDELRDHIFQMLPDPKLFYRWKERHQVRFTITYTEGVTCIFPLPFSRVIQSLDDGSWYFPIGEDEGNPESEWLLVRPTK
mmetsp:Transcript_2673/g.3035  ORF Transcript_2673/g.3035 Transcript_2673/m.3035 type:complete len:509 (+) Transcript_2673:152-1678(+)|eukprot:CAMPEP_0197851610 /NCGR_PEP_ID=MMETSP1438-20131217/18448_1 /TAXON_ID=1461541 /ORGANISM="Pterosperma sp., Strain CCMP1384" /LENGTH=508 /DNA_ID=CAMNT_0043465269 /DNA_START=146 /DNA_END=1672 /DNA_ORIENTATION=+